MALDPCAVSEWGGGIDPQITGEGEKWQLADIVMQAVDQEAGAPTVHPAATRLDLVHPAVTRVDRLLRLLEGLPNAKGDRSRLARFGDGERDKPGHGPVERQDFCLRPTQELRHLSWSRGDSRDLGILHVRLISVPA